MQILRTVTSSCENVSKNSNSAPSSASAMFAGRNISLTCCNRNFNYFYLSYYILKY